VLFEQPSAIENPYLQQYEVDLDSGVAAHDADDKSEDEKVQQLKQILDRAFHLPSIKGRRHGSSSLVGQHSPYLSSLDTAKIKYHASGLNKSAITNPRAILDVFRPNVFLKSGLSEGGQCQIIDLLMDTINLCYQTNCDALSGLLYQPLELLSCQESVLDKKDVRQ
jgi:hypothetical protein